MPTQLLDEDARGGPAQAGGLWDGNGGPSGEGSGGGDGGGGGPSLEDAVLQSSHHFYRCPVPG